MTPDERAKRRAELTKSMSPHEKTAFYAWLEVFPKQGKSTPSGKYTWRTWWERMYGEDFDEYAERIKARRG